MAKEKAISSGGSVEFFESLLKTDIYKRSQGRITRQVTCIVIWVVFALGAWRLYSIMPAAQPVVKYAIPAVLLVGGLWLGYRVVNQPTFADFLIAVEAEMNKVSWPSQAELIRASIVVIVLILVLVALISVYDLLLVAIGRVLGISAL
ncbi:MAG: preprotein translocase subunit SecE [Pirellulaceae bacterium]|jgi:preprotein translocase subunit SecE|nr:preprotein translocase subunit SecE [Pirellulaceae bacterium]